MEERKHIDRLYQEKFKDFEATPRDAVWNNISSRLQEKERKRKVRPLWYRLAGVAAVLALFLGYASDLFKNNNPQTFPTVSTVSDRNFGEISLASDTYTESMIRSSIILQALIQDTRNNLENTKNIYIQKETLTGYSPRVAKSIRTKPTVNQNKNVISSKNERTQPQSNLRIAYSKQKDKKKDLPIPTDKAEQSTNIAQSDAASKKLRVTTTAAPIYYDNLGNGSSIDQQFANNESSGEVTMSYGLNFAYQISERIKIRSGISKVDMSYNTRDISYSVAMSPDNLNGIDYNSDASIYKIENGNTKPYSNLFASSNFDPSSLASPTSGYLNQKLGFIEVPLEVEYVIIDKRIGFNIIGGGSTLFLDENNVSLNSSNFSTDLGEAKSLNNVSFTTNLGVGVDYKITPQFQFNVEPILKYQINTFNSNTGNLNSYYFGVYSGFSFKF